MSTAEPRDTHDQTVPAIAWRAKFGTSCLRLFFRLAEHAPRALDALRPLLCWMTFHASRQIKHATRTNARHLLGIDSTARQRDKLGVGVVNQFYQFCCDVGQSSSASPAELVERIATVRGDAQYRQARARKRGVILITAHLGSFEVGMAALRRIEPEIHVVFRRDAVGQFEQRRSRLRARLGIHEAAIDDGWSVWVRLRNALMENHAVILQADRVMPGQKGQPTPFFDGHLELPLGPVKLALASGSPIVPVFAVRRADGRIDLHVERAIEVVDVDSALGEIAAVLEKYIRAYPQQWLMLQPAWCEDQGK